MLPAAMGMMSKMGGGLSSSSSAKSGTGDLTGGDINLSGIGTIGATPQWPSWMDGGGSGQAAAAMGGTMPVWALPVIGLVVVLGLVAAKR